MGKKKLLRNLKKFVVEKKNLLRNLKKICCGKKKFVVEKKICGKKKLFWEKKKLKRECTMHGAPRVREGFGAPRPPRGFQGRRVIGCRTAHQRTADWAFQVY